MKLRIKVAAAVCAVLVLVLVNVLLAGGGNGQPRGAAGVRPLGAAASVVWVGGDSAAEAPPQKAAGAGKDAEGREAVFAAGGARLPSAPLTAPAPGGNSGGARVAKGMVSIDFDDGWLSAYEKGVPIVEAAGFESTHYIITEAVGWKNYMTWKQVADLAARGHEVGSHTRTHADLRAASGSELESETSGSAADLAARGFHPSSFSYPYGHFDADAAAAVRRAGFSNARSTATEGHFLNRGGAGRYALRSRTVESGTPLSEIREDIDAAIEEDSWLILVFHGVGDSRDGYSVSEQFLRDVVAYLKETGVPVVTAREGIQRL